MRGPDFIIVGAPKSGTTSLQNYLSAHPDIWLPQEREPVYYGHDLVHAWRMPSDEYFALFAGARSGQIAGEKSVWYLLSETAAQEIHAQNRDCKIIAMLRNPIELVSSLHAQFLYTGNETLKSLSDALAAEDARRGGADIPPDAHFPQGLQYTEVVRFAPQIERFYEAFGQDNVKVILLEEFQTNPAADYEETLRFLGVDAQFKPDFAVHNARKKVRSKAIKYLLRKQPWYYRMVPSLIREGLEWRLRRFNVKPARRVAMNERDRRRLSKAIAFDVERLGGLLGRDLSQWAA